VVDYLRNLMLVRLGNAALVEATADVRASMARQAERLEVGALLRAIRAFNTAANDARGGWQPQLPLELAVVECTGPLAAERADAALDLAEIAPKPAARPAGAATPPVVRSQPAAERAAPPVESAAARRAPEGGPAAPGRPAPSPAAGAAAPGRSGGELRAEWNRLLSLMRERDKATEALLRSCNLLSLDGSVLRLSTSEFVFKKISAEAARADIEALLAEVLGFDCTVKFEVASGKRGRAGRADDIPEDGMVATALDLGGEIVE
jgi:DNA polymerase-3 subunit gamma/tau